MNILFIMYDQLRFDYLGCAGHSHLKTPNFDRVAAAGVQFTRAYAQSPVCGASRMCFYTGRYASSHGAQWNNFPLRIGEVTLGDHLRKAGMACWLIGKTHMRADAGAKVPDHILEGRSLMPWLRGERVDDWRRFVVSELEWVHNLPEYREHPSPTQILETSE